MPILERPFESIMLWEYYTSFMNCPQVVLPGWGSHHNNILYSSQWAIKANHVEGCFHSWF